MKVMNIAQVGDPEEGMTLDEIAEEIRLTMSLSHPQVVNIHDFYQTKSHVYVVMELLKGGELLDAVMRLGHYTEKDAAVIKTALHRTCQRALEEHHPPRFEAREPDSC